MEDLDRICDSMSLEEPSNEEVPLTPLFIAFIHDHMQVSVHCMQSYVHSLVTYKLTLSTICLRSEYIIIVYYI